MATQCQWIDKPWGRVMHILDVSVLQTEAGYQCSRHYHEHKINLFGVVSGSVVITEWEEGDRTRHTILRPGDTYSVGAKVVHWFGVIESGMIVERYTSAEGQPVLAADIYRWDEGGKMPDGELEQLRQQL
jgi:hypothetical protein